MTPTNLDAFIRHECDRDPAFAALWEEARRECDREYDERLALDAPCVEGGFDQ